MRVRMNRYISGSRNGVEWPVVGGVIDLPDHEAIDLIDQGYADAVDDELDDDGRTEAEREADEQAAAAREALREEVRGKANADEVAAWVGDDPARARLALEVENAGRQRKGLTAQLEAIADKGDDDDAATPENSGGPDTDPPGPDGPSSGEDATAPAGSDQDAAAGDAAASRPW